MNAHGLRCGFLVGGLILSRALSVMAQSQWLDRPPGLEELEGYGWQAVDWRDYEQELEILIDECLSQFRVPFELPQGTRIVPGEDDKELTKERTSNSSCTLIGYGDGNIPPPDTKLAHGAIDVGSRITRDNGKTLEKLGKVPVRAIHPGGFVRSDGVFLEQKIICELGEFRLIVLMKYGHVNPDWSIGRQWQPTPLGNVGVLEGRNRWRSFDPRLSQTMPDKGNHIHLIVEGIYDLDVEGYIAHSEQLKGHQISKERDDLLRRRARWFNELLLPRVAGLR